MQKFKNKYTSKPIVIMSRVLVVLLFLQIAMFIWARYIDYTKSRTDYGSSSIMGSLFPEFLFISLGVINLILLIAYAFNLLKSKQRVSLIVIILVVIVALFSIFYIPITDWAISGVR